MVHRSGAEVKKTGLLPSHPKHTGKTKIATIARLVEKKGVEYGIQAVARIVARRGDVEYRIAGEGPLRERLQSLITQLNASEHVRLLGWQTQTEIAALLEESDILLVPSVTTQSGDEEGIPGVIMEAFARGLPVVGTDHAGIPEVVKDRESGLLVPERDVDALVGGLEHLINHPELRFAMGRKGRRFVEEQYDIENLNDRLVSIYQQLLERELSSQIPQLHAPAGSLIL
jgi:colanic acid/amylovoran biosynthesis glycosyltransferase